jgi:peptidyl-prolyl cis-trans isomerase SurA
MFNFFKSCKINLIIILIMILPISLKSLSEEIKIVMKINEQIVTNVDIRKEYDYLVALNNNLESIPKNEGYKIAQDSLLREIIKTDEIKKFIDLETFDDENVINNVLKEIAITLKLNDASELKKYLKTYNISLDVLKNKMIKEVLWNQLIVTKYKDKINIDIKKISNQIEGINSLDEENEIQYELSEILYQVNDQNEFDKLTNLIYQDIEQIGFKNTATKFSISETSKLGGYLGILNETQLSNEISEILSSKDISEYTEPIKVGINYLILFINDKKIIKKTIDKENLLKNLIEIERQKQFDNFSQIYFNKIKINSFINEF